MSRAGGSLAAWQLQVSLRTVCGPDRKWSGLKGRKLSLLTLLHGLVAAAGCIWYVKILLQHWVHNSSCRQLAKQLAYLFWQRKDSWRCSLTFYCSHSAHRAKTPWDAISFWCAWTVAVAKHNFPPNKIVLGEEKGVMRNVQYMKLYSWGCWKVFTEL